MRDAAAILQVAIPFTWLGLVAGISFLEAPLKFRAPGITIPLGLGIGRLVFRAVNRLEAVLAAVLLVALALRSPAAPEWGVAAAVLIILTGQLAALRPALDRRAEQVIAGSPPPPSHLHVAYILLETVKVILLPTLGVLLAQDLLA
ncbi:hypothetical protein I6A84_40695 [Frankia sp. CNm7]|uniref:Transmembrane protein n=1 Tax=Frankia nepalensis TaxID=1836974 RepID=A0A937RK42_9ACTN|nr:hypothetical protein [Frankia nepalensis]MBL7501919.1 hypothetical protein [Frankia nepalensis]MBL7514520.1 hypothetical protein [Frankia nepalensis]MBL7524194.1 hypothetical protein [Frankia nepalensis]MBL7628794.1 hypothetical protein [Frankia nepalensis]